MDTIGDVPAGTIGLVVENFETEVLVRFPQGQKRYSFTDIAPYRPRENSPWSKMGDSEGPTLFSRDLLAD